jgi:hypothetical protein
VSGLSDNKGHELRFSEKREKEYQHLQKFGFVYTDMNTLAYKIELLCMNALKKTC